MRDMDRKYNIINWLFYVVFVGLGIALSTKADFGLSMIAAPPYILHLWLRDSFSWFTQGTSEYVWEAFLLLVMCLIVRRFRPAYLLSFVTAVISGFVIDGWLWVFGGNAPYADMVTRIAAFAAGTVITALGVACSFRTTLPLQAYELVVKEVADRFQSPIAKIKQGFDILMFVISVVLALLLTGGFNGVGIGTVVITVVNSTIIMLWGKLVDKVEGTEANNHSKPE